MRTLERVANSRVKSSFESSYVSTRIKVSRNHQSEETRFESLIDGYAGTRAIVKGLGQSPCGRQTYRDSSKLPSPKRYSELDVTIT
jgi:hypothetical protein